MLGMTGGRICAKGARGVGLPFPQSSFARELGTHLYRRRLEKAGASSRTPQNHGGAFTRRRVMRLLLCASVNPGVYLGVQDVEGERAVAEDFVVEGAQVEFVT
jgi:hypothetical protein